MSGLSACFLLISKRALRALFFFDYQMAIRCNYLCEQNDT